MKVPANAWIVVADGEKALFLRNAGSAIEPELRLVEKHELENPPTRDQGTDSPGRHPARGAGVSSVEQTDWHEFEKAQFARETATRLNRSNSAGAFQDVFLIAPARTLGELRGALSSAVSGIVKAEIDKDLTKHTIDAILGQLDAFEG